MVIVVLTTMFKMYKFSYMNIMELWEMHPPNAIIMLFIIIYGIMVSVLSKAF